MQNSIPPRPRRSDKAVLLIAATAFLQKNIGRELHRWFRGHGIEADAPMLAESYSEDGYTFARNLHDKAGWPADGALVAILQAQAKIHLDSAMITATAEWVRVNNVKVPYKIGDRVALPWCSKGKIVDIQPGLAVVQVQPDEMPELWDGIEQSGWRVGTEVVLAISNAIGERAE